MPKDAQTLVFINLLFLLLYAAMAVAYRVTHGDDAAGRRGSSWFIGSHMNTVAAILLSMSARRLPYGLGNTLFVALLLLGHVMLHRGFAELLEQGKYLWRTQIVVMFAGIGLLGLTLVFPLDAAARSLLGILWGVQYGVTGLMLFRFGDQSGRVAGWFAGVATIAYAACYFLWFGAGLASPRITSVADGRIPLTLVLLARGAIAYSFLFVAWSRLSMRLEREANVDELTGLLNLRGMRRAAARTIARCNRRRCFVTVVMMDLDGLKGANDRLGHAAGDALLHAVPKALLGILRDRDELARIGGDEFCLLLPGMDEAEAIRVAERCRGRLTQAAIFYRGQKMQMSGSFGIAQSVGHEVNWDDLLRRSDAALYQAKRAGGNRVAVAGRGSGYTVLWNSENEEWLRCVG